MRALGIETGADLRRQTLDFLQDRFGKSGSWYYNIARGWDERPVQPDRERKSLGSETTFKMRALGIETGADLRRQTLDFLQDRFGKSGSWHYNIARGWDERPVQPDRERKSLGSGRRSPEDRTDPIQIEAGVIAMSDEVWAWCEKTNSRCRTVTVKIKWADFQISTRSRSTETTIQTREKLHQIALDLIRSVFPPPKGVQLVGVTLSNFRSQAASTAGELPFRETRGQPCIGASCMKRSRRLYSHVLGAALLKALHLPLRARSGPSRMARRNHQIGPGAGVLIVGATSTPCDAPRQFIRRRISASMLYGPAPAETIIINIAAH